MKRILLIAMLAVIMLPAQSQGRKYRKAMRSAIEMMNNAPDPAGELELADTFEQIAQKFPGQWLPSYHAGRILVANTFTEGDAEKKDGMLERAKKSLDQALQIAPEESEVQVLEALYYIGLINVDPMSRGEMYYQNALAAIQKSKSLNPDNPRAWYMDGLMTLNMPVFLGGGPEPAKPIFIEAAEKFKTFRNDDPFWPVWGADLVREELERLE
jgi:tetratricopeptide (TPR) repeat protein